VRILVTGGSGFIGRYLIESAVDRHHEVIGTYLSQDELSTRLPKPSGVEWQRLDMREERAVQTLVDSVRPDGVFHLAGQAYVKEALRDPADTFRTNVLGTIFLYEALRAHPPAHGTLLAGSSSSYGMVSKVPVSEDAPLRPLNQYGVSKATQDMLSLQYALNFGLRIVRARLFITTGPGKHGDALNDFASQIAMLERAGAPGELRVGNLDTRRDISDVRDVVRALWVIFEKGVPIEPVNLGAGQSYSIRDIAERLVRMSRVPVRIVQDKNRLRPTDEPEILGDVVRLHTLGYTPTHPIERTIADALEFWRDEG
jgi:GDP-4-dehydro-6-deoxy-D-mannose reductase